MSTFIIAEAGINHGGDINMAKRLVESAHECGCDAVKFQTYNAERRAKGTEIYDILKRCELTYQEQTEIKVYADRVGIEFFSTPFDEEALSFLIERLGLRRIKLASFDVTNIKMLKAVNEYAAVLPSLKVIMSTGMANLKEISGALAYLGKVTHLTLLHCVSAYPTPEDQANLEAIRTLGRLVKMPRQVGYSDHTSDILVPSLSVLMGARVVEKHFTLDLENGAVDNAVSANPTMMKNMVAAIRMHESMLGNGRLDLQNIEIPSLVFRRH